jgi:hypothetical protein
VKVATQKHRDRLLLCFFERKQMELVTKDYQGHVITYQDDGWFHATEAAERFGRRVDVWLKSQETQDYIAALCEISNTTKTGYLKTKRGNNGGTWMHPKLAVRFSQWLDPRFAVWCDAQIDSLIRGKDNWRLSRHASASGFKVASDILKMVRADAGKDTESHHYMCEAKLVNWALTDKFGGIDRDTLTQTELDTLAYLQERNAVLIGRGLNYDQRKPMIKQYAMDRRMILLPPA